MNTGISLQSFERNNISIATSNFTMTMCYLQNPCKIPQIDVVLKTFIYTNNRQLHKERDLSNHFLYLLCLTWQLRNSPLKINIYRKNNHSQRRRNFPTEYFEKSCGYLNNTSYRSYISHRNKIPTQFPLLNNDFLSDVKIICEFVQLLWEFKFLREVSSFRWGMFYKLYKNNVFH